MSQSWTLTYMQGLKDPLYNKDNSTSTARRPSGEICPPIPPRFPGIPFLEPGSWMPGWYLHLDMTHTAPHSRIMHTTIHTHKNIPPFLNPSTPQYHTTQRSQTAHCATQQTMCSCERPSVAGHTRTSVCRRQNSFLVVPSANSEEVWQ